MQSGSDIYGHLWLPAILWGMPVQCCNVWSVFEHIPVKHFPVGTLPGGGHFPVGKHPG